jgi:putative ABC transport system permease protein
MKRLLALFRKRRLDRELDAEIAAHLELAEQEAIEEGLSPAQARRTARLKFGGIESVKEQHRDRRSMRRIETFWRDLRHGFAGAVHDPGFSLVAIGVLALGIGANTAMFSLVDATLLRPLPFPDPEQLVRVWEAPEPDEINGFTTLDFLDWKRLNTVFEGLSVERGVGMALTGEGEPVRLLGRLVSADYFDVFGVKPAMGRTFLPGEDEAGAVPVVVLSNAIWRTQFGSDPRVLNREIELDRQPHTVVGILPPGPFDRDQAVFFKPLIFRPDQMNRGFHWLQSVGRMKAGITLAQAQEEMSAIDASLTDVTPTWKKDWGIAVEPYDKRLIDDGMRRSIQVAFGAVALVLLIACANVANLLLAKGSTRRREMAVRAALGASRGRLVSQLLTESLVLCLFGALAGIGLAQLLLKLALPLVADSLPFTADVGLDPRVLGYSAAATLGVSLLIGLLPSLQTSFARLSQSMNQGSRGSSASSLGLRQTIVVGEVAISLVLLCGSLLLLKSLLNLQQVDTGVRVGEVITMSVDLPPSSYSTADSARLFYRRAVEQLQSAPGVVSAALASDLPLEGVNEGEGLSVPGREGGGTVRYKRIDPNYLDVLDIALLAGRGIEQRDSADALPAALINEELAARLLNDYEMDNPVGQTVSVSTPNYEGSDGRSAEYQVVGIVRSEQTEELAAEQEPVFYVPLQQAPRRDVKIIVRASGSETAVMPAIREAIRQVDPRLPIGDIRTMEQIRDRSLSGAKQPTWVIGAFAFVAALLAALGLYGVLAHTVTQQRREIGIRMALGARSIDVLQRVLRNGLALVSIGLVLGLAGSFAMTRFVESMLFQVSALDPVAIASSCGVMLTIGLLAGFIPARRAANVQPMKVLRDEG